MRRTPSRLASTPHTVVQCSTAVQYSALQDMYYHASPDPPPPPPRGAGPRRHTYHLADELAAAEAVTLAVDLFRLRWHGSSALEAAIKKRRSRQDAWGAVRTGAARRGWFINGPPCWLHACLPAAAQHSCQALRAARGHAPSRVCGPGKGVGGQQAHPHPWRLAAVIHTSRAAPRGCCSTRSHMTCLLSLRRQSKVTSHVHCVPPQGDGAGAARLQALRGCCLLRFAKRTRGTPNRAAA